MTWGLTGLTENEVVVPEEGCGHGFYGKNKHEKYNLLFSLRSPGLDQPTGPFPQCST